MQILMWLNIIAFVVLSVMIAYAFIQTEDGLLPVLSFFVMPSTLVAFLNAIMLYITVRGLLARKTWAKYLAILNAALMLFGFPVGTVIGAVIIYGMTKGWPEPEAVPQSLPHNEGTL